MFQVSISSLGEVSICKTCLKNGSFSRQISKLEEQKEATKAPKIRTLEADLTAQAATNRRNNIFHQEGKDHAQRLCRVSIRRIYHLARALAQLSIVLEMLADFIPDTHGLQGTINHLKASYAAISLTRATINNLSAKDHRNRVGRIRCMQTLRILYHINDGSGGYHLRPTDLIAKTQA